MKASTRRTIEMATRVLNFSRAHPDPSPGYLEAIARLKEYLETAELLSSRQRNAIHAARAATQRKKALRRTLRRSQLVYLTRVAASAAEEVPELAQKFVLIKERIPILTFRTAAHGMLAAAWSHKEILTRHGLLDPMLQHLATTLDEFDQVIEEAIEAHRTHVGASAELDALEDQLNELVRLLDGLNNYRFHGDAEALAEWRSVRTMLGRTGGRADGPTVPAVIIPSIIESKSTAAGVTQAVRRTTVDAVA